MAGEGDRAYVAGLRLLARRELSEAQMRERLARRAFEEADVDAAVGRLKRERALDDWRTALACARDAAHMRHHGQLRALRRVEALGIPRTVARAAVAEVFAELDEDAMIERTLERRLRHARTADETAALRRVHRYLLAQGFDPIRVHAAIRQRARHSAHDTD